MMGFNNWARKTAQNIAEKDTPIVYITITKLKPVSAFSDVVLASHKMIFFTSVYTDF